MKLIKVPVALILAILFLINASAQEKPSVKVHGEVKTPLTLTSEDLSKMKRVTAMLKDHDGKEISYTGVPVQEILEKAGATMGKDLRGPNLAKYLLVKCADGYKVVLALAELDNGFTDRIVILSDESGGKPLPVDKGPFRLIVPGEKRPARSSFQVLELVVKVSE